MRPWLTPAVLLLAGIAAYLLWPSHPETPPPPTAAVPRTEAARQLSASLAAAPDQTRVPATVLRAAIGRAFAGAPLTQSQVLALAAGQVVELERELGSSSLAAAAPQLYDLAALCAAEGGGTATDSRRDSEHAALEALADQPEALTLLRAQLDARHSWQMRIQPGCAATTFEDRAIHERLLASAAAGNAASLERLAAADSQPLSRMTSAALLGDARAQVRLALETLPSQPTQARAWLEAGAKNDADALGFYGGCLLSGCFGAPDPAAARSALETAARRGSRYALGVLASAGSDAAGRWPISGVPFAPIPARDPDALGLDPAARYAWAALAATLARAGCFGFEFETTAAALATAATLERTLTAGELAAGRAIDSDPERAAAARARLGCD